MTEEQLKQYYDIFTDAWKLFREFSQPDGTTSFWERFLARTSQLDEKHKSELLRDIIKAAIKEMEKIEKEGRP